MSTLFTSHLNKQIISEQNLIYCSTFQLAWNEFSTFLKGEVTLAGNNEQIATSVRELNKKGFTKDLLDESCYMALADFAGNGIVEKITKGLKEKFNETSKFDFSGLAPDDIVAYSFLIKTLLFEQKFDEIETLTFNGTPVQAFGTKIRADSPLKIHQQIRVMHYKDEDEFTIALKTKSNQIDSDYIILAMLEPRKTLKETLAAVKIGEAESMRTKERLEIPKISFDSIQSFEELCGKTIFVNNTKTDYLIAQALQAIKFELDEYGAKLRSEAALMTYRSCSFEQSRKFIFDKPFLICLVRNMTDPPYFVAWIGNIDVLKKKS